MGLPHNEGDGYTTVIIILNLCYVLMNIFITRIHSGYVLIMLDQSSCYQNKEVVCSLMSQLVYGIRLVLVIGTGIRRVLVIGIGII